MSIENVIRDLESDRDHFYLANKTIDYKSDDRFQALDLKDAHCNGTIYSSKRRPYDWDGGEATSPGVTPSVNRAFPNERPPYFLRKPITPVYTGKIVNDRFTTLLFGQHRFPYVKVARSKKTEAYINTLLAQLEMKAHMLEAADIGGSVGSVIVLVSVLDGEFQVECFNTKWCVPVFENFHKGTMKAFNIVYPQTVEEFNPERNRFEKKRYLYRRVITKNVDVSFQPMELRSSRDDTSMVLKNRDERPVIDEEKTVYHGLGFVPAVFIQNKPRYDKIDGDTNCETAYDLFDRMNETLSAAHSGLQGNLDPTLLLKMTMEDYQKLGAAGGPIGTGATGDAIVIGDKGDGKYLEINGDGIRLGLEYWFKLRSSALDLCQCVIPDPERITGVGQSGSAMAKLYEPMLGKVDVLRTQYGERGLKRIIVLMLQIRKTLATAVVEAGRVVERYLMPLVRVKPETVGDNDPQTEVVEPDIDVTTQDLVLKWGRYFLPTADDVFKVAEAATVATGGKPVTTTKIAASFVAEYFDDPSPAQTVLDLEKQEEEAKKHALELADKGMKAKTASARPPAKAGRSAD